MSHGVTLDAARLLAAQLRASRTDLVAAVAAGELTPAAVAADPRAAAVKVVALAQVVPGLGKVTARRVMGELGIAEASRWGDLAPDVERELVAALTAAGGPPATGL